MYAEFKELVGKVLTKITVSTDGDDYVLLECDNGEIYEMTHHQDCCESVCLVDMEGEWSDLLGVPILLAEEACSETTPEDVEDEYVPESQTWTFYKLGTIKGYVDLRWWGTSNGYYSENVSFCKV